MIMNTTKFACAFLVGTLLGGVALASDGTINFTGKLTDATCTVKVNGETSTGTVTLPTLSVTNLNAAGQTGGDTAFYIQLSDCSVGTYPAGLTQVTAFYEMGVNVDLASGNLKNTATGTVAGNVQIQLLNDLAEVISIGQPTQKTSTKVALGTGGNLNYTARYYATGATTAGDVASSVTFSLVYN